MIQIYQCNRCGSIIIEDNNSDRSSDYIVRCPFEDDGEDEDVTEFLPDGREKQVEYENVLHNIMQQLRSLGINFIN